MSLLTCSLIVGSCISVGAGIYGLHRLLLHLEDRGWIYYLHKQPNSNPMSCLIELQKALEPTTKHVFHIHQKKPRKTQQDQGAAEAATEGTVSPMTRDISS